jgi:hypothetical protein
MFFVMKLIAIKIVETLSLFVQLSIVWVTRIEATLRSLIFIPKLLSIVRLILRVSSANTFWLKYLCVFLISYGSICLSCRHLITPVIYTYGKWNILDAPYPSVVSCLPFLLQSFFSVLSSTPSYLTPEKFIFLRSRQICTVLQHNIYNYTSLKCAQCLEFCNVKAIYFFQSSGKKFRVEGMKPFQSLAWSHLLSECNIGLKCT